MRHAAEKLSNFTIPYVDRLLAADDDSVVSVYHDLPSDEATMAVLRRWAGREARVRIIVSDMAARGERVQRLALCRNVLFADARALLRAADGALVMLDLDCRAAEMTPLLAAVRAVRRGHSVRPDRLTQSRSPARSQVRGRHVRTFGVLTANSVGPYRDMWALRSSALGMDYDCFHDTGRVWTHGSCKRHRIVVSPTAAPFEIEAGFNGIAAYSAASLRESAHCRYVNETNDDPRQRRHHLHVVSEHVPFQRCMRRAGVRVGLQPSLLTRCHGWATRYDAMRTFYLRNGTVVRLANRHQRSEPSWEL